MTRLRAAASARPSPGGGAYLALGVAIALVSTTPAAAARKGALSATRGDGRVVDVTPSRAYLDRGTADGLRPGLELALSRRGKRAGSCTVERVVERSATCTGGAPLRGDTFPVPGPAVDETAEATVKRLPAPSSREELDARRAELERASLRLVEFQGATEAGGVRRVSADARLGTAFYGVYGAAGGTFLEERVDLALRGAEVFPGGRLYADLTALHQTVRPDNLRFRPDAPAQLYVREAQLAMREPGRRYALSIGRIWPWHLPGVALFDGVQAGARNESGTVEVGAFGGGLPEPSTLAPRLQSWTSGAYGSFTRIGRDGEVLSYLRQETRLAALQLPDAGGRSYELEAVLQAALASRVDVSADVLAGYGAAVGGAGLWAARADLGVRPVERLRLQGGFRWLDDAVAARETFPLTVATGARRADLGAWWDVTPALTLGASAGTASSFLDGATRNFVSPELSFPGLLGRVGTLGIGYQEEFGWLEGRSAWVQVLGTPWQRVQLLSRLSYLEDASGDEADPEVFRELGLSLGVAARLARWLALDASTVLRAGVLPEGSAGLLANLGLRGEF